MTALDWKYYKEKNLWPGKPLFVSEFKTIRAFDQYFPLGFCYYLPSWLDQWKRYTKSPNMENVHKLIQNIFL